MSTRRPSLQQQNAEQQRRIDDLLTELRRVREDMCRTKEQLEQARMHGRVLADGLRNTLDAVDALRRTVLSFKATPDPAAAGRG